MYAYSPALYFAKCIQTAWGICSRFISTAVFGDTIRTMSATSLYAFLVRFKQTYLLTADFGRLIGKTKTFQTL